jgi:hypothetical protein
MRRKTGATYFTAILQRRTRLSRIVALSAQSRGTPFHSVVDQPHVMLAKAGVKVLDFGLAKSVQRQVAGVNQRKARYTSN